ncbi:MraZ domain protein [Haemophilus pittmaniae HK 85]|uniref:MraZ domain protein n=1 Tax=Haemophilus pittmaniae HK 85 TaxID=1035188 RepID=F9QAF3_9PAST|nr:MraZ domain protein [Haemophilus pittmaniae HK 85]
MFRGAAAINLDAKGRVAIPTRYRSEILEKTKGKWFVQSIFVNLVYCFIH